MGHKGRSVILLALAVGLNFICSQSFAAYSGFDIPDFNSPACGNITQIRTITPMERSMILKGRCFVLGVLGGRAPSQEIVWNGFYRGLSSKQCHGLTRFGPSRATSTIYLFDVFPRTEKNLISFNQIGSTTLHEFHHYWNGSRDDDTPNDPKNIYDDPALDAFMAAINLKLSGEPLCSLDGESGVMKNHAHEIACQCGIKFWSPTPIQY